MTARTTETTVVFNHPFVLSSIDGAQPAGRYRVVVDEDEIDGLSYLAYRRTATMLHLPAVSISNRTQQIVFVDPAELQAALEHDGESPPAREG